ncbi:TFIIB-type zinc ribbon-containing protein [Alsobacter metallidurans]|uniref:TFIIB-type zinc ribbon-containing protein n=1 Tax=Alsobacter metallidurans TaxID=340221 RepID=UPI0016636576|nr:zf-TFIIB domain-containing protein [Alsobacter metallidurans]
MTDTQQAAPHGLSCPVCRADLLMSERSGIEIDYCPKCRGVWLDRGELDKIIERTEAERNQPTQGAAGFLPPVSPNPWGNAATPAAPHDSGCVQPFDRQVEYDRSGHASHGTGHGGYRGHGDAHGHGGGRRGSFLGRLFD